VPDPLGFLFFGVTQPMSVTGRNQTRVRIAGVVAVCVIGMLCALVPASAHQSSSSDSTAKKPATSAAHRTHKTSATSKTASAKTRLASSKKSSRRKKKVRGQQKIDSERAQAIQEALIREHYLSGTATGTWNADSEAAMRRYQADHGWQSKTVPDSRALIKLGLGPSNDHLLNPESAMTTVPDRPKSNPVPPTSNSSAPVANPVSPSPSTNTPVPASASSDTTDPQ